MSRAICEHQAKLLYIVLFLNPKNRPKPRLGATSSVSTKKWAFPGFGSVLESLNPALGQAAAHPITQLARWCVAKWDTISSTNRAY
jgi:hypothetical protein